MKLDQPKRATLTADILHKGLDARRFGRKIYTFETIDSTNNCAKALAEVSAEEGTVVLAESQTAGRGRMGRSWHSPTGENLIFSVVLRPSIPPEQVNLLPLYTAVAVAEAIEAVTGIRVDCKWPNDLLIDGRKVAGILLEGSVKQNALEYVILGIGINVNQQQFPRDLADTATSLALARGTGIDRAALFRSIVASLEDHYTTFSRSNFQAVIPHWMSRSSMLNRTISVSQNGAVLTGTVKGLSSDGALVLHVNGSEKTFFAGDVTLVKGQS